MPDFEAGYTAGTTLASWLDPADGTDPPRISHGDWPLRNRVVTVGVQVEVSCLVGGAILADAALGGRLFSWSWVEWPGVGPPSLVGVAGTSAVRTFVPLRAGHHCLVVRRAGGGSVVLHCDSQ